MVYSGTVSKDIVNLTEKTVIIAKSVDNKKNEISKNINFQSIIT